MLITESFQSELLLSEEDKRQSFWVQDDTALPYPLSPLFASFMTPSLTNGTKLALENLKHPMHRIVYKLADGRIYQAAFPHSVNPEERLKEYQKVVGSLLPHLMQRLQNYVDQEFLPFYRRLEAYGEQLTLDNAKEKVLELFDFYHRAWQLHFEIVLPRSGYLVLESIYTQLTGDPDAAVVYDMLSGVMNKSLETDRALWKLAELVKQSPETTAAFSTRSGAEAEGYRAELEKSEAGREFLARLQEVLEEYGHRSANSHEFADETWVENPEHALRIIAAFVPKSYDFDVEFDRTVQQREVKATEVLTKLPEGELKDTFMRIYRWALDSWGLDEDHHFYIDAMLPAKSRRFLLRVGDLLAEQDVLSERGDIVYLYLDELLEAISSLRAFQSIVEQRKSEHEVNKLKQVPPFYGTPPQEPLNPALERLFGGKPPEFREQEKTFSGYAASKGTYTGTVKLIRGPQDFAKVQSGDVLVCKTTTPPWTVLFSVAGAIVTDAGGILSHAGTVAREYRLPAVVGTKVATTLLKDGDRVTVDGTAGLVYFG